MRHKRSILSTLALAGLLVTSPLQAGAEGGRPDTPPGQQTAQDKSQKGQNSGQAKAKANANANANEKANAARSNRSANANGSGQARNANAQQADQAPNVGNSGTIKISAIGAPVTPANDPHPGCGFRVDVFGFRQGTLNVTVALHPPTGSEVLLVDTVEITSDARGNELNTSRTYDIVPLLPEGDDGRWHIRVDAQRTDHPGEGAKTKVFWITCPVEPTAPGLVQPTVAPGVLPQDVQPIAAGEGEVLPAFITPPAGFEAQAAAASGARLAITGGGWRTLLLLALLLMAAGLGLTWLARRADA